MLSNLHKQMRNLFEITRIRNRVPGRKSSKSHGAATQVIVKVTNSIQPNELLKGSIPCSKMLTGRVLPGGRLGVQTVILIGHSLCLWLVRTGIIALFTRKGQHP